MQSFDTLFNNTLTINSNPLDMIGYIEVDIQFPRVHQPLPVLVTVIQSSILNENMPALIGSNALEVWRLALNEQYTNVPPIHPIIDTWSVEKNIVGVVKSVSYCDSPRLNCAYINSKLTVPVIKPYDRKVIVSPNSTFSRTVAATTVHIPKYHSVIFFELPVFNTKEARLLYKTGQPLGSASPLSHSIPLAMSNLQQNPSIATTHVNNTSNVTKEEFLQQFNSDQWPDHMRCRIEKLLWYHKDTFALSHHELGKCDMFQHVIKLSDYTPIKSKYRRIPPQMYEAVKEELKKLMESGVIEPSISPWSSPISIAVKSDGSPRITLDFRKINAITKKDAKSMPNVDEIFDSLHGKKIFSSLDLMNGYFQLELSEQCREITAFTAGPLGFYQFKRMPMGLTNSGATFQRAMEYVLRDLVSSICLIYIDDVIVHSHDEELHLQNLDLVFTRLQQYGLRLKPSKCNLFCKQLKFLGHVISEQGLSKDESKIQAIRDWEPPTNIRQVRRFLGVCGFLRRYIKNFATIAQPLTDLLHGYSNKKCNKRANKRLEESQFAWTDKEQDAFDLLKQKLSEDVILAFADFTKPFRLSTDACRTGLGAVLEQKQDSGKWRPIAYASRRTSQAERQYPTHKLEFLALKWAVTEKFPDYLRSSTFTCLTDNNPLTYIFKSAKLDAVTQRWVSALEQFDFKIMYLPGNDNIIADALSRKYEDNDIEESSRFHQWAQEKSVNFPEEQTHISAATLHDTMNPSIPTVNYDWRVLQSTDATISSIYKLVTDQDKHHDHPLSDEGKRLLKNFDDLVVENKLLYLKDDNSMRLVVPEGQQEQLTSIYHSFGHFGITRVYKLLKEKFFWPHMIDTVTKVNNLCVRCQKSKTPKQQNKGPLGHIECPPIPMYQISMDFLSIDTRAESKFKILTAVCEFTKYAFAFVVTSENAVKTANTLYRNLYTKFGIPRVVHTDRGATFLSKVISELNKMLEIKQTTTVPYRPQSNSSCERLNSTIIQRIRTLPPAEKKRWNLHVDSLLFAYNATVHESTGISPFYAMFGRKPTVPTDLIVQLPDHPTIQRDHTIQSYAKQRKEELKESFQLCVENIRKRRERNKRNFDAKITRRPTVQFHKSDKVLITKHLSRNKIDDNYLDEVFEVVQQKGDSLIYIVKGIESNTIKSVHRDDMVLFKEDSCSSEVEKNTRIRHPKQVNRIKQTDYAYDASDSESDTTDYYIPLPAQPSEDGNASSSEHSSSNEEEEARYNLRINPAPPDRYGF